MKTKKLLLLCAALSSSCAQVLELDQYHVGTSCPAGGPTDVRTLTLQLTNMTPHPNHKTFIEISRSSPVELQALAVLDGIASTGNALIVMPNAIAPGGWYWDMYSDVVADGVYSGIPRDDAEGNFVEGDHAWRRGGTDSGCVGFEHTPDFNDIASGRGEHVGGDFRLTLSDVAAFDGRPVVIHLVLVSGMKMQGYYRFQEATGTSLVANLAGIVAGDSVYRIEVWSDSNDNDLYEAGTDDSWVIDGVVALTGGELRIDETLSLASTQTVLPVITAE